MSWMNTGDEGASRGIMSEVGMSINAMTHEEAVNTQAAERYVLC